MSRTTTGKVTDGRNVATGEGSSAIAYSRGPTDTAFSTGPSHLTNERKPTSSLAHAQHGGESCSSSDEENPHVIAFEQDMDRYQSRGKPDGPAKGKPQKPPPSTQYGTVKAAPTPPPPPPSTPHGAAKGVSTPVPPQRPPPSTPGVAVQVRRTPAITAYQPTTAPGHGKRRA